MDEKLPGIERPDLQALPQIGDRMTFLYLEHCQLNREDGAILIRDDRGSRTLSFPRTRGGDPEVMSLGYAFTCFSPRRRG